MNSQKNPLENFQEISSEKVDLPENLQDKKLFLFQIPKNVETNHRLPLKIFIFNSSIPKH